MGKKQHQKDKMYLTTTEWTQFYGGYKKSSHSGNQANFRRLPLTHCTLSLIPFEHPFCDLQGNIFDLEALLPFLKKFKKNPVTGKVFLEKDLIKLKFHKNQSGEYHCPVLYKSFTNTSHVVAIKTTGNVFSFEAVEQLNIKANNWKELLTDEPFKRSDIVTLQDPNTTLEKFNISSFYHVKHELKIEDEELVKSRDDASFRLKNVTHDTKVILDEYSKSVSQFSAKDEATEEKKKVADRFNAAHYSSGKVASSFTSTAIDVETENEVAVLDDHVVRYRRVKKKGYVSLQTNLGNLNLELHCDVVPKTCENFVRLCKKNYYTGTKFHRSIRHFMIQGGDPTGTGNGGESCWGGKFEDEIKSNFSHQGRGILSMANSGPDTNGSQFFMTFRSCQHLDSKHTIFGRVVGGLPTLSAMEAIETDNKDRPIEDIVIVGTSIFVDPFEEADNELNKEREELKRKSEEQSKKVKKKKKLTPFREGVGKFLDFAEAAVSKEEIAKSEAPKKQNKVKYRFSDFSEFS